MTVLTIPPEVAAGCAKKLFALAATANRDAMTLIKQAMALAKTSKWQGRWAFSKNTCGNTTNMGAPRSAKLLLPS